MLYLVLFEFNFYNLFMFTIQDSEILQQASKQSLKLAKRSFGALNHYDPRINRRVIQVAEKLYSSPATTFSKAFKTKAERKAAYRLISNDALEPEELIDSIAKGSFDELESEKPELVIVAQDTSVVSTKDFDDVGLVGKECTSGFFFHSAIGISIEGIPLNLLGMKIYTRGKAKKSSREAWKHLPLEEKESYRWVEMVKEIVPRLPASTKPIFVSDRESDMHEYFQTLIDSNAYFVVRHSHNRRIKADSGQISNVREQLSNSKVQGITPLVIPKGHNRKERIARVNIQWENISFHIRSGGLAIHKGRKPLSLTALRIFEPDDKVQSPIEWILYTNLSISCLDEALEVLRLYTCRWRIEEFHLTLKTGMKVERNRFGSGTRIQRLLSIATPVAIKLLGMIYKSRHFPEESAEKSLSKTELEVAKAIIKQQTGRKPIKVNLGMLVKHVAFLGGWMGRKCDGPPGIRTFWEGWRQVQMIATTLHSMR
ncbi:MAG: IS4 family transposase [Candidatus Riflebacteria bacterium]